MQKRCIDREYSVFICVCASDTAEGFRKAYESIVNQTPAPSQVVICADNITGTLLQAVEDTKPYTDVVYVNSKGDHAVARAAALRACRYEAVGVMDADDIALAGRFEVLLDILQYADVAGGDIREFSKQNGAPLSTRCVPVSDGEIKQYMKKRCPFNHMTVMYRKSAVEKCGGYLSMFCNEDYYLWIRMAEKGCTFANSGKVLCLAGVGDSSYERRGGKEYFQSEKAVQKYMLQHGMISKLRYGFNLAIRFVVQRIMTAKVRQLFYRMFLRKKR